MRWPKEKKDKAVFICPNCGAVVSALAPACPECGSDKETGWSDEWYPEDEAASDSPRPEARRKPTAANVLKYAFIVLAALALGSFVAYEIPVYGIFIGAAIVLAVVIASLVFRNRPPSGKRRERSLEQELLALSGHDPARLERLVNYERNRKPDGSRIQLLERAIERLIRDRGR